MGTLPARSVGPAVPLGPAAGIDLLTSAAYSGYVVVRERVAAHRNATSELLILLAHDPVPSVRAQVARNPKLPAGARAVLERDDTDVVRRSLPSATPRPRNPRHVLAA